MMKTARDMHNMLQKRPLSADGAGRDGGASEAKRSPRLMMDRMAAATAAAAAATTRLRSPVNLAEHEEEDDDEDGMEASDMRMATTDEDAEDESRLRDSKRNIKLLHNSSSRDEDRPRSAQHPHNLDSGEDSFVCLGKK